jgi:protein PhnA
MVLKYHRGRANATGRCRGLLTLPDTADCYKRGHNRRWFSGETPMAGDDDDYIYDEATGEWRPASEIAAAAAAAAEVRDASGNVLKDGDSVTLIKDLKVKGAGQTLKQGTVNRSIRLTDNPEEIDCRHDTIKGLVLRTEFVRKR